MAQKQPPYVGGVGTIGVGGTTFTVTGALDDTNCIEGDHVRDPATGYESRVLERLTVQTFRVPPWRGAALAGAAYELYPDSNLRGGYQAAVTTQLLARLSAKGLVWILPPEFASPTAAKWGADEDQYVFSPSLKLWWVMQAGAWTPTGAPYGMMAANALSEINGLGLAPTARANLGLPLQAALDDATAGRVLSVGSFGAGKALSVRTGNILGVRPSGEYYLWDNSANPPPPYAGEGYLRTIYLDDNNLLFEFYPYNSFDQWLCTKTAGAYSAWINVGTRMTPDRAFRRGNVLGSVTQTGGVPTGALIETGSNAGGRYARFADGTQICFMNNLTFGTIMNASGGIYQGVQSTYGFPANFVDYDYGLAVTTDSSNIWAAPAQYGTTAFAMQLFCFTQISSSRKFSAVAIGRWF